MINMAPSLPARVDDELMEEVGHHGTRTAWLAHRVARWLGLDAATAAAVAEASRLHDIGKHFVATEVLWKPGSLTARERRQVEMHAVLGASALIAQDPQRRTRPDTAVQVALLHHEWWNGMGYPFGLTGTTIPIAARIAAVADVFDALALERCYKPAWPRAEVMAYLRNQRGRQFDPLCADAMLQVAARLPKDWAAAALAGVDHTVMPRPRFLRGPQPPLQDQVRPALA